MMRRLVSVLAGLAAATGLAALAGAEPMNPAWPMAVGGDKVVDSANDPADPFTRPNPEAEIGKLPNGLTYGVMRRAGTRKVTVILI